MSIYILKYGSLSSGEFIEPNEAAKIKY